MQRVLPDQQLRRHAGARTAPLCTITCSRCARAAITTGPHRPRRPGHGQGADRQAAGHAAAPSAPSVSRAARASSSRLRSAQNCTGTLTGQTVNTYAVTTASASAARSRWASVQFSLKAGKAKTVVLKLTKASKKLLAGQALAQGADHDHADERRSPPHGRSQTTSRRCRAPAPPPAAANPDPRADEAAWAGTWTGPRAAGSAPADDDATQQMTRLTVCRGSGVRPTYRALVVIELCSCVLGMRGPLPRDEDWGD